MFLSNNLLHYFSCVAPVAIVMVDERYFTLEARDRYWEREHLKLVNTGFSRQLDISFTEAARNVFLKLTANS